MKSKLPGILLMAAAFFATIATAQDNAAVAANPPPPPPPPVTLRVGDPAPAIRFGAWLKGESFERLAPGQVYVIEFWATWCGPCRGAMPHLSALAKKYAGQAVFTGVNVWESAKAGANAAYLLKVEAFVKSAGDMMAYNVAVDTESSVNKGTFGVDWLTASGQRGIPSTFVIGRDGRIAWIGHPLLGLDEVVGLVIEDKLDATAAADIKARYKAMMTESTELRKQLAALQKAGDAGQVVVFADEIMAKNSLMADSAVPAKYAALASLDQARARAYADEIMRTQGNAPYVLRGLATKALEENNPNHDYSLAVKLMETAMRSSTPTDLAAAPVMAEAYFKAGSTAKAVAMQQAIVDAMKAENEKQYAQYLKDQESALAKYQAGMAGKSDASSH